MIRTIRTVKKLLGPVTRRLQMLAGRAVISGTVDDGGLQRAQIKGVDGQVRDGVEVFQLYGFSARPLDNSEAVVLNLGGDSGHPVVIAHGDRRHRLTGLENGEVALYTDEGHSLIFRRGGNVTLTGVHLNVDVLTVSSTGTWEHDGAFTATGDVKAGGSGGISLLHHKHGGVQAGGAQTSEPV